MQTPDNLKSGLQSEPIQDDGRTQSLLRKRIADFEREALQRPDPLDRFKGLMAADLFRSALDFQDLVQRAGVAPAGQHCGNEARAVVRCGREILKLVADW